MEKPIQDQSIGVIGKIMGLMFLVGIIVFEYGLYSYFSRDGSPWLIMIVMNAIYFTVAFCLIGGLGTIGRFGMYLGVLLATVGLFLFGISTYTL